VEVVKSDDIDVVCRETETVQLCLGLTIFPREPLGASLAEPLDELAKERGLTGGFVVGGVEENIPCFAIRLDLNEEAAMRHPDIG
jgi:hypothetical protein